MNRVRLPQAKRTSRWTWRVWVVHAVRIALVVSLLLAIPSPRTVYLDPADPPELTELKSATWRLPTDVAVGDRDPSSGLWPLVRSGDRVMGWVARTLPQAADAVGYRGPTEAWIILNPELVITAVGLLDSEDTKEHVEAVVQQESFFRQFHGWRWGRVPEASKVDAVSGATLTSMALAEGIIRQMGSTRPSLLFPKSLHLDELSHWYPNAVALDDSNGQVFDEQNQSLGYVIRTGPYSDDLVGYQGPSELLLRTDPSGKIESVRIRGSFDNEPYVDYVRTETGFWKLFQGMSLRELAEFRPQQAGVEGVSGATMTSQRIADTLVAAAGMYVAEASRGDASKRRSITSVRWTAADVVTITLLVMLGGISRLGWFRMAWFRRFWLLAIIGTVGLWSGNLISLALVAGWSAEGVAWRLAPGLAAMAVVAMLVPTFSKGNPYCNHLCPHGALQQLIRPVGRARRRRTPSQRMRRVLTLIPGTTLAVAYLALLWLPSIDLATWEPFHAYLFRIAGWGSLAFALASLVVAAMIPMAYCRFGCATGRLIDYLRLSAESGRIVRADLVAVGLLLIAITRHVVT